MKTVVLITETSNACVYGVGTYVSQLKQALEGVIDIRLFEVIIEKGQRGDIHYDDSALIIPIGAYYSVDKEEIFQQGVARLLTRYIEDGAIFHFNLHRHLHLMRMVAEYFPSSPRIYTIHYQNWSFRAKGVIEVLNNAVARIQEKDRSLEERLLCDTFLEEQDIFSIATHIVTLCEYTAQVLKQTFKVNPLKISTIKNGLAISSNKELRNESFSVSDGPMLLYVGRLHEDKGILELVRAYKEVYQQYPNSKLFIVGDGDFSAVMKEAKGLWSNIVFTGRLEKEEVYSLYRKATIGILPSYTEQCSYTAIEMMMFGLPIVGVRTTGLSEMIRDGETGLSIPLEIREEKGYISDSLLSECILEAIEMRDGINLGIETYYKHYSLDKMRASYISLYKTLCL